MASKYFPCHKRYADEQLRQRPSPIRAIGYYCRRAWLEHCGCVLVELHRHYSPGSGVILCYGRDFHPTWRVIRRAAECHFWQRS
ncbi:hypothetical protein FOVG_18504 [Fusarium oxysporum f. sp. pisi HDV247]|uniref:Uncharacterized protein n=1 Tax=Fusarium oxysporum f. sp. pisi HDV247 TaxID=1080344 RepID=W9NBK4_FUSOX|nr:hypothetical protein FOVG_18504 [Fusarium oxysporum f. sp. pisi HDV247]